MQGSCFCRPDLLSQCIAVNYKEQMSCRFFIISGCGNKCMYRNEQLNNHCWQPEAQSMGLHSEVEAEPVEEEEEGWELKDEKRVCISCIYYECSKLLAIMQQQAPVQLLYKDLKGIAMKCEHYGRRPGW